MKLNSIVKKLGIGILSLAAILSCLPACGGDNGGGSKTITEIEFANYQGCAGDVWLKDAAERFSALKAEESYESGKRGVKINVSNLKTTPYTTINSEGYDIYIGENKANIYAMASSGYLLDLSEVAEGIESKIDKDAIKRLKGADGKYYGLPSYEWYSGVTYDQDFFTEENLYLAAPETTGRTVNTKFGTLKLVSSDGDKKSCGPDGVYNTEDDGMPSSLMEFVSLMDFIKNNTDRSPFVISGASIDYAYFLVEGLWASLAGTEQIKTIYSLDSNGKEIVEVVTGFSDEDLFYYGSGIKKPITEKIAINEDNGYKIYDMASRYYGLATLQLIYKEGWFEESFLNNSNKSNIAAQFSFVNEKKAAILYDASFWCSESVRNGDFAQYARLNPDNPERNVSFMALPVTVDTPVTEGNGVRQALLDVGAAQLFVSRRVANNEGKKNAVIDFLKFLYSDSELAAFTESTGLKIPVSYEYDGNKLNDYYKKLTKYVSESDVIYFASDSIIVNKNLESFALTWSSSINKPIIDGVTYGKGYLDAMRMTDSANCATIFEATRKTASSWESIKK